MLEKLKQLFRLQKSTETAVLTAEKIEEAFNSLGEDVIRLELGSDIVEFSDIITEKIDEFREDVKSKTGFILPPVHVLRRDDLQENELIFYVRGKEVEDEFIVPNKETVEKYVYDTLNKIFEDYLDEIFTMEYVEKYITKVQTVNSWLLWDISKQLGAYEIKTILVNVIKEKKSIADINRIFEKIDECLAENRDCYYVWKPEVVSKRICKEI